MRTIIGWSLKYRLLMLGIAAALMVLGVTQLARAPMDLLPEFSPPYVEVQTEALGLSAEEVEQLITVPLEADLLHGVAWLDEIHSESVPGLSSIVLLFDPGTDVIRARQMVAERLTQAHALPNVSKPPVMIQPLSSMSRVMLVGLSSRDVSLIDMSVLARWTIRPRLLGVPGVANVAIWGQRDRQLQVLVDPRRLRHEGVTLQQVVETAGNALWASPLTFIEASTPGTGGFIDTPSQRLGVQHILPIRTPEDMASIPVEEKKGVVLGDVATIVVDHQPLIGDAIVNDAPGLILVIEKFPDANTLEVTREVDEALAALRPGMTGIDVDASVYRPADFVASALGNVLLAVAVGLLLVALLLGLLLDWRAAVVTLVTMPVALVVAGLVLQVLGATFNALVLAGLVLALGIVIDDVVTGTESVISRLRERRAEDVDRPVVTVIVDALGEGRTAIAYATAVVVLVVLPAAFIAGALGTFLVPVVMAYVVAVLASLLVAMTIAPALLSLLALRRPGIGRASALGARLEARYESLLATTIRRARPIVAGAAAVSVAVLVAAVAFGPQLGGSIVPQFGERDLLVRWAGSPATSRGEMDRIVARATAELRGIPGVRSVGAHVGRAITSDRVVNTNAAEIWVSLDPAADYRATRAAVEEVVQGYPGIDRELTTYSSDRVADVLSAPDHDVVVRVYGQDQAVLEAKAAEVRDALSGIEGMRDPTVLAGAEEPALDIRVDIAAAERHGLKPGDIRRATTSLLSGIEVGFLFEDQKVFEVVVWGVPELRHSPASVGDLRIDTPGGTPVRLAEVADVRIAATPTVIRREGVMRILDVAGDVEGRDLGAVMAEVDERVSAISFPLEYHAEVRALAADRQADLYRLLAVIVATAVGVLLLLQASFASWRLAALAFVTLPAAILGGLLAGLAAGGGTLTLGVLVGLLTVVAIAARNSVVLIAHLQRRGNGASPASRIERVARAAGERLAPVVMTAVAAAVAVAPLLMLGDMPGFEVVRPMAAAILGGLVTSTLVTLFVMPSVFLSSGPSPESEPLGEAIDQPALSPA